MTKIVSAKMLSGATYASRSYQDSFLKLPLRAYNADHMISQQFRENEASFEIRPLAAPAPHHQYLLNLHK
jgi:hypothetical protein